VFTQTLAACSALSVIQLVSYGL